MAGWAPPPLPGWWSGATEPVFVGRQEEFATLEEIWAEVADGNRQVVFVGGEPGTGKSRLVAEAARALERAGTAVLVGQCLSDGPVAYQPFRDPVRALIGAVDEVVPRAGRDDVRNRLASLVGAGSTPPEDAGVGPAHELYDAVVTVLGALARERPTALVLEDLHWSSPSTRLLLSHLVTHLVESRLLVVATHRPTPPDRDEEVVATITDLYRHPGVHRLDLGGLSTDDVTSFLRHEARIGTDDARPLASRLRDHTGGNPFFLQEVCRDIRVHGTPPGRVPVPGSVRDTFSTRLARLDDEPRETVELAAVLGERFPLPVLLSASGLGEPATLAAIEVVEEQGLLTAVGGSGDYRFPHALARQAVLELVGPTRRARHHARAARALESRRPRGLNETRQLAFHYRHAYGAGPVGPDGADASAKAYALLLEAARMTERALAHHEAAEHYAQAADSAPTEAARHEALMSAARCHTNAGAFRTAMDITAEVAEASADPGARLAAATAHEHAARHFGEAGSAPMLTDALEAYGVDLDDPAYVRGLASLSRAMRLAGITREAIAVHDSVLARARAMGDPALLAHALDTGLWLGLQPDRARTTLDQARELSDLGSRLRLHHMVGSSGFFRSSLAYTVGDRAEMERGVADMRLAHERSGLPYFDFWSETAEFGLRFLRGDFGGARRAADRSLEVSAAFHGDDTDGLHGFQVFMVRRETGELEAVRPLVLAERAGGGRWAPGLLALCTELGLRDRAAAVLATMLDDGFDEYRRSALWPVVLGFAVEAALMLGDDEALARLRPLLLEHRGTNLLSGQFVGILGSADRLLGCVDAVLGEGDPLPWFASAAALDERTGSRIHLATTLALRAQHLCASGSPADRAEGRRTAERARAMAEPIGQGRVLAILDGTHPVHRVRPVRSAPSRPTTDGVTARELEVLGLLADGASNADIAASLVISHHTAANHVRHIMTKTGTANRTQAVMTAVAKGWIPPPE
jgi:DNA-binding CsgD family transcriptional regulator